MLEEQSSTQNENMYGNSTLNSVNMKQNSMKLYCSIQFYQENDRFILMDKRSRVVLVNMEISRWNSLLINTRMSLWFNSILMGNTHFSSIMLNSKISSVQVSNNKLPIFFLNEELTSNTLLILFVFLVYSIKWIQENIKKISTERVL